MITPVNEFGESVGLIPPKIVKSKGKLSMKCFGDRLMKKSQLPEKPCVVCHRPMIWRKSWAKNWENVKYCSDRCRQKGRAVT